MSNKFSMTIANSGSHNRIKDCDLSTATLTTLNWFHMKPIYFKEVVPGEEVDIDISGQMQMLALNKPMFSNIRCMVRSFFVPYRTVFSHWNAFITDSREKNRKYNSVPQFPIIDFLRKFISDTNLVTKTKVQLLTPLDSYDFIVRDLDENMFPDLQSNEAYGCVFTPKGRRFYDILVGLGYNFNFGYTYDPNALNTEWRTVNFGNVSALNLMAYGKIICDWFTLPAYQDKINTIAAVLETMSEQYGVAEQVINQLFILLDYCVDLHYADDLFVSAWDNPISPNNAGDANTRIKIVDITNNSQQPDDKSKGTVQNYGQGNTVGSQQQYSITNGTPFLTSGEAASTGQNTTKNITQYILNALQKLSSFARRNQLVGYRPLDRYLARFGKKLSSEQLIRSWVLGDGAAFNVEINPVLSQSDTVGIAANMNIGTPLGDKAGQGFGTLKDHLHFKAQDEFGMLIVVCYVVPYVKYYQGLNPTTMRVNMTDFYQPEFDGLGCEAIPAKQLYSASMNSFIPLDPTDSGYNSNVEDSKYPQTQAFGFAPRFYAYKTNPFATVSGDFRFNSRNAGMEQWHLFRKIRDGQNTPLSQALSTYNWQHNQRFTEGASDAIYYNRIFQQVDGENDGFILGFNFNVKADLPMKPLYDDAILNSDPDAEHQSRVTMNVGGTRIV